MKQTFYNCIRPTDYTKYQANLIFKPLMNTLDLHCQNKDHEGFNSHLFVGASNADLERGRTLHLFVRDDGLVEFVQAKNCIIQDNLLAKPNDTNAFNILSNSLKQQLGIFFPDRENIINHEFDAHDPLSEFLKIGSEIIISAHQPSTVFPRLIPA